MLISELSHATGFSKDTIRYYEKIGLIELPRRARLANNYKDYGDDVLRTLHSIRNLKELGFTLEEIREIIVRRQMDALDRATTCKIIEQKLIHLDIQIDKLLLYKEKLQLAQMQARGETTGSALPLTELRLAA